MKQLALTDRFGGGWKHQIAIHETEVLEHEAEIAIEFCTKWGMVAGMPDGEDSSGRAKMRLATPEEVVTRAFDTAKLIMDVARLRKLVVIAPDASVLMGVDSSKPTTAGEIVDKVKERGK